MGCYFSDDEFAPEKFDWIQGQGVFHMTNCIDTTLATVKLDPYDKWHVKISAGRCSYHWPHTFETDSDALNHADELLRLLRSVLPLIPDLPREKPNWSWDD